MPACITCTNSRRSRVHSASKGLRRSHHEGRPGGETPGPRTRLERGRCRARATDPPGYGSLQVRRLRAVFTWNALCGKSGTLVEPVREDRQAGCLRVYQEPARVVEIL